MNDEQEQSWFEKDFDPSPRFVNHMCHWGPWANKHKDDSGEIGTVAQMLYYACEEIDKLRKSGYETSVKHSHLLFAFIHLVETGRQEPFNLKKEPSSIVAAFSDITLLNKWRKENKLNILEVDK